MNIIFDIETAPLSDQELEQFKPVFEASKVLKDPEKIKADIAAKEIEWKDKAALSAHLGRIIAIGFLEDKEGTILCFPYPEKRIVEMFWEKFNASDCKFIGHYCKGFDVPFIIRRSFILGVKVPESVMEGRYLSRSFIDTMEVWASGTRDTISLDNLSKALGCGSKSGKGEDFSKLFMDESTRSKALEYLENDLKLTKACADKMGIV